MLQAKLNHLYGYVQSLDTDAIAIAYSGGGDSTALLHMLRDYPGVSHAFIVDHALREGSDQEARQAAEFARHLGYVTEVIKWDHDNPAKGLQVKARAFRYAAMGRACRAAGIKHLMTAHTADDQAETILMRKARDTGWRGLAGMAKVSYAPLWPALADVYLHRPLLQSSRQDLRDYNIREGLSWVDDPSNENQDFTRIQARTALTPKPEMTVKLLDVQAQNWTRLLAEQRLFGTWLSHHANITPQGYVLTERVPPAELLLHLLRAVSGTGGPIDAARRENLVQEMGRADFTAATLAGAWVVKTIDGFLFTRDMSAVKARSGETAILTARTTLPKDEPYLWDGRFMITARKEGIVATAAHGRIEQLSKLDMPQDIQSLPKEVRPTLPVYEADGQIIGFGAGEWPELTATACHSRRLSERFPAT